MSEQEPRETEEQSEPKVDDLEVSEEQSEDVKGGGIRHGRPEHEG